MAKLILISVALIGIAFLLLGFNIFFRKGKTFPESEIGKNKAMQKAGIKCSRQTAFEEHRKYYDKDKEDVVTEGCGGCCGNSCNG